MNDGNVAQDSHANVLGGEATDTHRLRCLLQKLALVNKRPIGVRAQKVFSQDLLESPNIAVLDRIDVIAV